MIHFLYKKQYNAKHTGDNINVTETNGKRLTVVCRFEWTITQTASLRHGVTFVG